MIAGVTLAFALMLSNNVAQCPDIAPQEIHLTQCVESLKPRTEAEDISDEEFELLARCVEAEAGDQGYLGKCYVVDCILNRCDKWHKSIKEIIFQPHQFEVVSNNRINTVKVTEETRQAIRDELRHRTNMEILHFRMDYYHSFGVPVFQYKDHYFSK